MSEVSERNLVSVVYSSVVFQVIKRKVFTSIVLICSTIWLFVITVIIKLIPVILGQPCVRHSSYIPMLVSFGLNCPKQQVVSALPKILPYGVEPFHMGVVQAP